MSEILQLEALSEPERARLCRRTEVFAPEARAQVAEILSAVRRRGDQALREYTERLDGATWETPRVPSPQIRRALDEIPAALRTALETARSQIERFHEPQRLSMRGYQLEPLAGVRLGRLVRPYRRVGIYVPRNLPSSLLMAGVPARLAGVRELSVCTPPQADGSVPAPVRAAAALLDIEEVYAVGGAQAIAALAYGTETIPAVEKITGPGNSYVTAAKALLCDEVGIDLLAGPSEILLLVEPLSRLSEETLARWALAELKAQLEHGPGTAALLLTSSTALARRVAQTLRPEEARDRHVAVLRYSETEAALAFANAYAPEHLALWTEEPEELLEHVQNAGSVLLGPWSPLALGDYASGTNHILPTGGQARFAPGLGVSDFVKTIPYQRLGPQGVRALAAAAVALAEAEGMVAHAESVRLRLEEVAP